MITEAFSYSRWEQTQRPIASYIHKMRNFGALSPKSSGNAVKKESERMPVRMKGSIKGTSMSTSSGLTHILWTNRNWEGHRPAQIFTRWSLIAERRSRYMPPSITQMQYLFDRHNLIISWQCCLKFILCFCFYFTYIQFLSFLHYRSFEHILWLPF